GWHPYFLFPSGNRNQGRLILPFTSRTEVNNYDDVFPTGRCLPVAATPYDFRKGAALNGVFLDDCFVHPSTPERPIVASLVDASADYALRIECVSPNIRALQTYAPVDQPFVALEPQFNLADPFGDEWNGEATGMVWLAPGESTEYAVELTLERAIR